MAPPKVGGRWWWLGGRAHVSSVLAKLALDNRTQVALLAHEACAQASPRGSAYTARGLWCEPGAEERGS